MPLPSDIGKHPERYHCVKGDHVLPLTATLKYNMKTKGGVAVFVGRMGDTDVVVKWHRGRRSSREEEEFYLWLRGKTSCPEVYPGWTLQGDHVLVMEKLQPLNDKADPVKIGLDLLKQLKVIHKRCVHNGIKPDNITYRETTDEYLLIDHGSIADTRLEDGYLRKSWPSGWSSQPRKVPNQVTYPVNDLYELCTTLKSLSRTRKERRLFKKALKKVISGYDRHRLRKWLHRHAHQDS